MRRGIAPPRRPSRIAYRGTLVHFNVLLAEVIPDREDRMTTRASRTA
jgi:hypothetical protein